MVDEDVIDHWLNVLEKDPTITLYNLDKLREQLMNLSSEIEIFTVNLTGIFAYIITTDMIGRKQLVELFFYIHPWARGNLHLVKLYIDRAELCAKRKSCNSIAIGGNIKFKDDLFIKLLKRRGYIDHTVYKEL